MIRWANEGFDLCYLLAERSNREIDIEIVCDGHVWGWVIYIGLGVDGPWDEAVMIIAVHLYPGEQ
jgi:hypothetical protein